ncbi:hypothetical protein LUZ61_014362 [Rhynchospora tenuis]|uniref:Replication protein A 70 kDa DNA-binding subunit B/D first OB fold domain-containing protein n=1 Tax=Rhynchospora tenuis TaxID=198213 RepID=A0AAD5WCA1_9POAL|nr:hypothetical protein LUZ61_014362 [Rhynchospora tenuis]
MIITQASSRFLKARVITGSAVGQQMDTLELVKISDLPNKPHSVRIQVRIIRVWAASPPDSAVIWYYGTVLVDAHGGVIEARILKVDYQRLSRLIEEGRICEIARFSVTDAPAKYHVVPGDHIIYFTRQTTVTPLAPSSIQIPLRFFAFERLDIIGTEIKDKNKIIDLIGRIAGFSPIKQTNQSKPYQIMYLADQRGSMLEVTLWSQFLAMFDIPALYEQSTIQPVIVICAAVQINEWDHVYGVKAISGTRFYFDSTIPEIVQFAAGTEQFTVSFLMQDTMYKCVATIVDLKNRYKLLLTVKDETDIAEFVALGKIAKQMTGIDVDDMIHIQETTKTDVPPPLLKIIGKAYEFILLPKEVPNYPGIRRNTIIRLDAVPPNASPYLLIDQPGEAGTSSAEKPESHSEQLVHEHASTLHEQPKEVMAPPSTPIIPPTTPSTISAAANIVCSAAQQSVPATDQTPEIKKASLPEPTGTKAKKSKDSATTSDTDIDIASIRTVDQTPEIKKVEQPGPISAKAKKSKGSATTSDTDTDIASMHTVDQTPEIKKLEQPGPISAKAKKSKGSATTSETDTDTASHLP